jgi:hypothetical protein
MNWQRFLNLVKKTGDRLIVVDKEEGEGYVIMSLSEYEDIISRTGVKQAVAKDESEAVPAEESAKVRANVVADYDLSEAPLSDEERFYLEPIE